MDEWIGDDWLEAFLKDHEVEAEAWKCEVWLVFFLRVVKLPVKYHLIFFQKGNKVMRNDTSLLGKDTCKQIHGLQLLGNTILSHCDTQHCRKNVEKCIGS